ncbi:MAG TPA: ABC transporter substrate-binding protein [Acidimicrobiales bacterium]
MKKSIQRPTSVLVALLAVFALLLGACSSDSSEEGEGSTATTEASGGEPSDIDPNGIFKMTYNLVQTGGQSGFQLNPMVETGDTNDNLLYLIYGRILRPTPEGGLEPDQAESTSIPDANTIKITLRPDQTFHDGTVFDAAAVKASLDASLAANNEAGLGVGFYNLESVTADGDLDLTLTIKNGLAASWHDQFLSSWKTSVIPQGANFNPPIGAGPMEVTSWTKGTSLSLKSYDGYWDRESIKVAGVDFTHNDQGQEASALAALQAGQVDYTQIDVPQISSVSGDFETLIVPDPNRLVNLQICKREGPLADPNVRIAMNKAMDRAAISEAVYEGTSQPGTQLYPEGHQFYVPELADVLAYDQAAAKQLLTDAGYPDGFEFDLYILPALGLPDVAAVYKQQLAEIGVTANLLPTPGIVKDWMETNNLGMGIIPSMTAGVDRLNMWTGDSISNVCDYNDPEVTDIRNELLKVSSSSDEAVELWGQAADIVVNDALSVFVSFSSRLAAYNTNVVGDPVVYPLGTFPVPDFRYTYVKAS